MCSRLSRFRWLIIFGVVSSVGVVRLVRVAGSVRVFGLVRVVQRRRNHIAHNASLPTILSKCRCHMIFSFQTGSLEEQAWRAIANVSEIKYFIFVFADTEYISVLTVFSLPFLKLKCLFGRVSFPGSLSERRMVVLFTTVEHAFACYSLIK